MSCRADDATAFDTAAALGAEAVDVVAAGCFPIAPNINVATRGIRGAQLALAPLADRGLWHLDIQRERAGIRLLPGWHTAAEDGTDADIVVNGGIAVTALSGRFASVDGEEVAAAAGRLAARLRAGS